MSLGILCSIAITTGCILVKLGDTSFSQSIFFSCGRLASWTNIKIRSLVELYVCGTSFLRKFFMAITIQIVGRDGVYISEVKLIETGLAANIAIPVFLHSSWHAAFSRPIMDSILALTNVSSISYLCDPKLGCAKGEWKPKQRIRNGWAQQTFKELWFNNRNVLHHLVSGVAPVNDEQTTILIKRKLYNITPICAHVST